MTGDVIKSFLVGLGFDVDESSLSKFNKSIATATVQVTALYAAITTAATGVAFGISEISSDFEKMGYEYRIIAPAINKAIVLRNEMLKAYRAAGLNITKVVQESVRLNFSLAKTKFAFEAIYKSVGAKFFGLLTKQSDLFRQKLYENLPKIQAVIERVVSFLFKAFDSITQLGGRLVPILSGIYDFFAKLDTATNGWSTAIVAVLAAWKLLNLEFLATPLGAVIAGLTAILLLVDDFEAWKSGGKSLFDWSSIGPAFTSVKDVITSLASALADVGKAVYDLLFHSQKNFGAFISDLKAVVTDMNALADAAWRVDNAVASLVSRLNIPIISKLLAWRNAVDQAVGLGSGNGNFSTNQAVLPGGIPLAPPLGAGASKNSSIQNNQINLNAPQQTTITTTGSADAAGIGKHVGAANDQHAKTIFDLTANMMPSTVPSAQ